MNQITDNHGDAMKNQNTKTPQVVMPNSEATIESIEITSEQIEANIDRLLAEEFAAPTSATTNLNFDATAYAKLTSGEPTQALDQAFGEADPYVNLEEPIPPQQSNPPSRPEMNRPETNASSEPTNSAAAGSPNPPPAATVDEILSRLPDYYPEPDSATPQSTELTESNKAEEIEANKSEKVEARKAALITIEVSRSNKATSNRPLVEVIEPAAETTEPIIEPLDMTVDESSPSIVEFAESTSLSETADRVDVQSGAAPASESTETASMPVPIVNAGPETGGPIFDVRDFSESAAGTPEPIPGSYEVAPDAFDFHTAEDLSSQNPGNLTTEPEQVFMAGEGGIIQIDGNDGFDFIDLACFDVNSATFSENLITIDDNQGNKFEIRHQNVSYALFEDGVQVILTSD